MDRQWLWDKYVQPWVQLKEAGVGVMVGECGAFNKTPHDVTLRWMEDCLKNWQQAGSGGPCGTSADRSACSTAGRGRQVRGLPRPQARPENDGPPPAVLTGSADMLNYRLCVGDCRVLFEIEGRSIVVYRVRHRPSRRELIALTVGPCYHHWLQAKEIRVLKTRMSADDNRPEEGGTNQGS